MCTKTQMSRIVTMCGRGARLQKLSEDGLCRPLDAKSRNGPSWKGCTHHTDDHAYSHEAFDLASSLEGREFPTVVAGCVWVQVTTPAQGKGNLGPLSE